MKIAILCTGDELLKGNVVNTNLAFVGQALSSIGLPPALCEVVPDDLESMHRAMSRLQNDYDLIISSGGLGSTGDDVTRKALCRALNIDAPVCERLVNMLEARYAALKRGAMPECMLEQARLPRGAEALTNVIGSAPGIFIKSNAGKYFILLPGPPNELIPMFENEALPRIEKIANKQIHTRGFMLARTPELKAERKIRPLLDKYDGKVDLALCTSYQGVKIFLSGKDARAVDECAAAVKEMYREKVLLDDCFSLAADVIERLKMRNLTFATAESCTGGLIASDICSFPGVSQIFKGSVIAYNNEIKEQVLNVDKKIILQHGAVSSECVSAMLDGICEKFSVDTAVAVSGIAGPEGGTKEKPVGLIYIGAILKGRKQVTKFYYNHVRNIIRERAAADALESLRQLLLPE